MEKALVIYTDGACEGNPGPGGWAAVLLYGRHRREISGSEPATTNNRMELRAAIESLAILKGPCRIELHTDSQYVREGITRWIHGWKRKGWRGRDRQPVKNVDLELHTDSQYVREGITRWIHGWKRKGWRGRDRQPVKNVDLWQRLDACAGPHRIDWRWLRGHAGHEHNERCDALACARAAEVRGTHSPERLRALLAEFKASQRAGGGGGAAGELPL